METITMDFSFPMTSRDYGRFLVACHDHFPGIRIEHVEARHNYSPGKSIVSVSVPDHVAMLLKLEFGTFIVKRPDIDFEKIASMKIIKNRNSNPNYTKNYIKTDYSNFDFKNIEKYFDESPLEKLYEGLIIK